MSRGDHQTATRGTEDIEHLQPINNSREMVMNKTNEPANSVDNQWTVAELVSQAFELSPDIETAIQLLEVMLGGRSIQISDDLNSGE
ncbi:MAG: hypothetical protein WA117_06735 [Verrucomicrobiia bacterium]